MKYYWDRFFEDHKDKIKGKTIPEILKAYHEWLEYMGIIKY